MNSVPNCIYVLENSLISRVIKQKERPYSNALNNPIELTTKGYKINVVSQLFKD